MVAYSLHVPHMFLSHVIMVRRSLSSGYAIKQFSDHTRMEGLFQVLKMVNDNTL